GPGILVTKRTAAGTESALTTGRRHEEHAAPAAEARELFGREHVGQLLLELPCLVEQLFPRRALQDGDALQPGIEQGTHLLGLRVGQLEARLHAPEIAVDETFGRDGAPAGGRATSGWSRRSEE